MNVCVCCVYGVCARILTRGLTLALVSHPLSLLPAPAPGPLLLRRLPRPPSPRLPPPTLTEALCDGLWRLLVGHSSPAPGSPRTQPRLLPWPQAFAWAVPSARTLSPCCRPWKLRSCLLQGACPDFLSRGRSPFPDPGPPSRLPPALLTSRFQQRIRPSWRAEVGSSLRPLDPAPSAPSCRLTERALLLVPALRSLRAPPGWPTTPPLLCREGFVCLPLLTLWLQNCPLGQGRKTVLPGYE